MIQHIVLFKLKPNVDETTIAGLMAEFRALSGIVDGIHAIEVQRDIVGRPVSAEFGLVVTLTDLPALQRYRDHPAHQAAFAHTQQQMDHMLVLDYELDQTDD